MPVLNVARPPVMDTEELRIFQETADRFLDEHASSADTDGFYLNGRTVVHG